MVISEGARNITVAAHVALVAIHDCEEETVLMELRYKEALRARERRRHAAREVCVRARGSVGERESERERERERGRSISDKTAYASVAGGLRAPTSSEQSVFSSRLAMNAWMLMTTTEVKKSTPCIVLMRHPKT